MKFGAVTRCASIDLLLVNLGPVSDARYDATQIRLSLVAHAVAKKLLDKYTCQPTTAVDVSCSRNFDLVAGPEFFGRFISNIRIADRLAMELHLKVNLKVGDTLTELWRFPAHSSTVTHTEVLSVPGIGSGPGIRGLWVEGLGSYEAVYRGIFYLFQTLGVTDKQISLWVRAVIRGDSSLDFSSYSSLDMEDRAKMERYLVKLAFLLFGCEPMRNPAALIHNRMLLDLIEQDIVSWRNALALYEFTGGGLSPMSMEGAVSSALELRTLVATGLGYDDYDSYDLREKISAERTGILVHREADLTRMWLCCISAGALSRSFADSHSDLRLCGDPIVRAHINSTVLQDVIENSDKLVRIIEGGIYNWYGIDLSSGAPHAPGALAGGPGQSGAVVALDYCTNPFYNYHHVSEVLNRAKEIGGRKLLISIGALVQGLAIAAEFVAACERDGIEETLHFCMGQDLDTFSTIVIEDAAIREPVTTIDDTGVVHHDFVPAPIRAFLESTNKFYQAIDAATPEERAVLLERALNELRGGPLAHNITAHTYKVVPHVDYAEPDAEKTLTAYVDDSGKVLATELSEPKAKEENTLPVLHLDTSVSSFNSFIAPVSKSTEAVGDLVHRARELLNKLLDNPEESSQKTILTMLLLDTIDALHTAAPMPMPFAPGGGPDDEPSYGGGDDATGDKTDSFSSIALAGANVTDTLHHDEEKAA